MNVGYYYLLASMPLLTPGKTSPVTAEGFLAAAETALPAPLFRIVRAIMHEDEGHVAHPFLDTVLNFEAQIVNAQAQRRAEARNTEPGAGLPYDHVDLSVVHGVNEAFQAENPLLRERELAALRFSLLDDLVVGRPYGEEAVLAYALKLRLALRLAGIDPESGRETFRDIAERVAERIWRKHDVSDHARSES
ncbi:hypothetical protein DPQ33_16500 [Oceanidesulfovibrio indonesiensis]|uniref:DUF2764 domain-containing protein n=1 Tax=Oceanidesulfovibrio indonesiensis TaxID=54767 RepID=A0A7M3MB96_9BACT|nr:hypothetical protein DPQ33_16500 [Oceanidesulfovibrio indonesiensis]